jgi:hypothetical protein
LRRSRHVSRCVVGFRIGWKLGIIDRFEAK